MSQRSLVDPRRLTHRSEEFNSVHRTYLIPPIQETQNTPRGSLRQLCFFHERSNVLLQVGKAFSHNPSLTRQSDPNPLSQQASSLRPQQAAAYDTTTPYRKIKIRDDLCLNFQHGSCPTR